MAVSRAASFDNRQFGLLLNLSNVAVNTNLQKSLRLLAKHLDAGHSLSAALQLLPDAYQHSFDELLHNHDQVKVFSLIATAANEEAYDQELFNFADGMLSAGKVQLADIILAQLTESPTVNSYWQQKAIKLRQNLLGKGPLVDLVKFNAHYFDSARAADYLAWALITIPGGAIGSLAKRAAQFSPRIAYITKLL